MTCVKKTVAEQGKSDNDDYLWMREGDLYFHLVRLTAETLPAWREFALEQRRLAAAYRGHDLSRVLADKGFKAFLSVLESGGGVSTDIRVAVAASAPIPLRGLPSASTVEMFASVITSRHACFTGHMGIGRTLSFTGFRHAGLACQLHAFAAKATLMVFSIKKLMLTVPASRMREILVHSFADRHQSEALQIGDGARHIVLKGTIIDPTAQSLAALLAHQQELVQLNAHRQLASLDDFERTELAVAVARQHHRSLQAPHPPLVQALLDTDCWTYRSFQLHDRDGRVLQTLTQEDMAGEYAWFFKSPYFVCNPRQPLVAVRLDELARMCGGLPVSGAP